MKGEAGWGKDRESSHRSSLAPTTAPASMVAEEELAAALTVWA